MGDIEIRDHHRPCRERRTGSGHGARGAEAGNAFPAPRLVIGPASRPADILALQRSAGNAAVGRLTGAARSPVVQRFLDPASPAAAATAHIQANAASFVTAFVAAVTKARSQYGPVTVRFRDELPTVLRAVGLTGGGPTKQVQKVLSTAANNQPIPADTPPEVLGYAVRVLNALEEETQTQRVAVAEPEDVAFGTEFTFTNSVLRQLALPEPNAREGKPKASWAAAGELIRRWERLVRGDRAFPYRVEVAALGSSAKAPDFAVKFSYFDKAGKQVWWWALDVDASCLETQTEPSTVGQLGSSEVEYIITNHIFKASSALGLQVDRSVRGGGGHISVDSATAFGGSVSLFLGTLSLLQTTVDRWLAEIHGDQAEGYDRINAPWLRDLTLREQRVAPRDDRKGESAADRGLGTMDRLQDELTRIEAEAAGGTLDIPGAARRLIALNGEFDNPLLRGDKRRAEILSELSHYQAVNVEHMGNAGASRRLELRDVPAQESHARLMHDLKVVLGYLAAARQKVRGR